MVEPEDGDTAGMYRRRVAMRWAITFAVLLAATVGMLAVRGALDKAHVALMYLLIVLGASAVGGRGLGLAVTAVAFLCFDFFFLSPYTTLVIANPLDWLVLVAFLATSAVAAQLLYRANATAESATQRAVEVDRLAALGAETLNAADADEALLAIADVIRKSVDADECDIFLQGIDGHLRRVARAERGAPDEREAMKPGSLAEWIIAHGASAVELADGTVRVAHELSPLVDSLGGPHREVRRETIAAVRAVTRLENMSLAGRVGDWLRDGEIAAHGGAGQPSVRAIALPLLVRGHTVGVLRLASTGELRFTPEQARLLMALAYYAALGAERARLVATAERAEAERRMESLRGALLTAVSHDLRTPLTTIKGIANELLHGGDAARAAIIESEADRLNALVGDLLDLSRIHAKAVRPALAVNTVDDLLGAALAAASGALRGRAVHVDMPTDDLLAGVFDFTQTLRIIVNLLDNAAKYSPAGNPIDVRTRRRSDRLVLDVMDRGPGVDASERDMIFGAFYRPPGVPPDVRGYGLGLSIARGLAEAEGGSVSYAARPGGGSIFTLDLPAADVGVLEPDLDDAGDDRPASGRS
jgi:two-component system, OmpR family, sensor histidine kinase KdpD